MLLSYFKCPLYLPLRNFRGGSTVSRAGLLAATRVMVQYLQKCDRERKTLFAAQAILYVYVTDGQNGAYFSAPRFDSIEINGHFRHFLSGGWCLKMLFLVFYSWDRSAPIASTTQFISFSAIPLHKNPVEESPDNCLISCCECSRNN